ncbi:MAG: AcrR family transcriptional regulator [Sulfurimonas sp.]|jgi:AcrR family transcriptional regulator|uniref:TetR/AcrR family transcriptional regulator n=1 Tax=Sulfurimonas sp. TaxID=2022749 RepID=UPI0039E5089D
MAIIVDKVQKRQDIALSCKALVLENGMKNLTIAQLAKTAGVGKGTIYDYFKNKEDLIFEIVYFLMQKHSEKLEKEIVLAVSTKDKIKAFARFFYDENEYELRGFYKEFMSIALSSPNEEMLEFNAQCSTRYQLWFGEIIQDGIDKNEIIPHARKLLKGLFAFAGGMFLDGSATNNLDTLEQDLNEFIDAIFILIEVK